MAKKPASKNSKMMMTDKEMKKTMGHSMAEHKMMMEEKAKYKKKGKK